MTTTSAIPVAYPTTTLTTSGVSTMPAASIVKASSWPIRSYSYPGTSKFRAVRLRSGLPFNPAVGADLNGDGIANERPLLTPGLEMQRNYFVNRGIYDVDLRVQKTFKFGESKRLQFSAEFFNILNRPNLTVGTS